MAYNETIKTVTFSGLPSTFTATTTQSYYTQPIIGEIKKIHWKTNITGSMSITISGLGEVIYNNNAPSGASYSAVYPAIFSQASTGSIAGASMVPFIVNALPLSLNLGSALSGTTMAITDIQVFYK